MKRLFSPLVLWSICLFLTLSSQREITYFENEILAFEQEDQKNGYLTDFILFTGSSSIRKWQSLSHDFEPLCVLNRGFGGCSTRELTYYLDRIIGKHDPSTIVIYCGENDVYEGFKPTEVQSQINLLISRVRNRFPDIPIIYIGIKPSPKRQYLSVQFKESNKLVEQMIKNVENTYYIDISSWMLDANKSIPYLFTEDSLHMNQYGYDLWSCKLKEIISSIQKPK